MVRKSLDVSRPRGTGDGIISEIASSLVEITGSPRHSVIQRIRYSQNVAGLWLKYGVKSRKIRDFQAPKKSAGDATIF